MKLKVNTKALIKLISSSAVIPFTKPLQKHFLKIAARSVDEIKHDIQQSGENQQTYTIKYRYIEFGSCRSAWNRCSCVVINLNNISNMI